MAIFSAAYFSGLRFICIFYEIYILEHSTHRSVEPLPIRYLAHSPTIMQGRLVPVQTVGNACHGLVEKSIILANMMQMVGCIT